MVQGFRLADIHTDFFAEMFFVVTEIKGKVIGKPLGK